MNDFPVKFIWRQDVKFFEDKNNCAYVNSSFYGYMYILDIKHTCIWLLTSSIISIWVCWWIPSANHQHRVVQGDEIWLVYTKRLRQVTWRASSLGLGKLNFKRIKKNKFIDFSFVFAVTNLLSFDLGVMKGERRNVSTTHSFRKSNFQVSFYCTMLYFRYFWPTFEGPSICQVTTETHSLKIVVI